MVEVKKYIGRLYVHREKMVLVKVVASGSDDEWADFENSDFEESEFLFLQVMYGEEALGTEGLETDGRIRCSVGEFSDRYAPIAEVKTRTNLPSSKESQIRFMLILDENRPVVNPVNDSNGWWPVPAWRKFEEKVEVRVYDKRTPPIARKKAKKKSKKRKKAAVKAEQPVGDSWETRVANIVDDTDF